MQPRGGDTLSRNGATGEYDARLSPATRQELGDWHVFRAPDCSFEVSFPDDNGIPAREDDAVKTPIGLQDVVRYKLHSDNGEFDAGYLVRNRHVLAAVVGENSILRSACEGAAAHMRGRILRSSPIEIDGHIGREIEVEIRSAEQHIHSIARLVITEDRIYHAIATLPRDGNRAVGDQFVQSFHLGSH